MRVGLNPKRLAIPPHFFPKQKPQSPSENSINFQYSGGVLLHLQPLGQFFFIPKANFVVVRLVDAKGVLSPMWQVGGYLPGIF